jgi:flagellar basal-body rod modification protein FlgD
VTTPISATAPAAAPTGTSSPTDATGGGKDMFMKLLVAQLKYQNPMSPTDNNEYMSQMAMFTQVEKLGQLLESQQQSQAWQERLAAEAMVGRQVTGSGSDAGTHTGVVTGVTFGADGSTLTLEDGTTLAADTVSRVEQAPR